MQQDERKKQWCRDVGYWIDRCEKFGEERDDAVKALELATGELELVRVENQILANEMKATK